MGNRVYTLTKKNVQNRIKSIIFPYTSKKQSKMKLRNLYTIVLKRIKY